MPRGDVPRTKNGTFMKVERVGVICPICGKTNYVYPSEAKRGEIGCTKLCQYVSCSKYWIGRNKGLTDEKAPNWRGGITRSFRNKKEYKKWKYDVFEKDNFACVKCLSHTQLHAHHIIPITEDVSKSLDVSNGITLCLQCHQKEHPELTVIMHGGLVV